MMRTHDLELVLVRHGETVGQSSIRLHGASDVPLNALGRAQMRAASDAIVGPFDHLVVSPLSRSREGGAIVAAGRCASIVVVDAFRELYFGDWEGWTLEEAKARDPVHYREWEQGGIAFRFPGGESRAGFQARVLTGLAAMLPPDRSRVLAVLHTGVIRVLIAELLGLSLQEQRALVIPLGSIQRLRCSSDCWQMEAQGEITHLQGLRLDGESC